MSSIRETLEMGHQLALEPGARLTLLVLLDMAHPRGWCLTDLAALTHSTGLSQNMQRRAIDRLASLGLLKVSRSKLGTRIFPARNWQLPVDLPAWGEPIPGPIERLAPAQTVNTAREPPAIVQAYRPPGRPLTD